MHTLKMHATLTMLAHGVNALLSHLLAILLKMPKLSHLLFSNVIILKMKNSLKDHGDFLTSIEKESTIRKERNTESMENTVKMVNMDIKDHMVCTIGVVLLSPILLSLFISSTSRCTTLPSRNANAQVRTSGMAAVFGKRNAGNKMLNKLLLTNQSPQRDLTWHE